MKESDSISTIDLIKGINFLKNKDYNTEIVVAVLDTDIDIYHKDIRDKLWINSDDNTKDGIDNDKNSFIDDKNGWNFLGTIKDEKSLQFTLMEETRILRKFNEEDFFKLNQKNKIEFTYKDVKNSYDTIVKNLKEDIIFYKDIESTYSSVLDTLKKVLKKEKITLDILEKSKSSNSYIEQCIDYVKSLLEQGFPYSEIINELQYKTNSLDICMNLEYDNRLLIKESNNSKIYGSSLFGGIVDKISHGTKVAGVIASSIKTINNLKYKPLDINIMPICISGIGDPTDQDTALAIRYAVDNGAKIINLSQTKTFSICEELVADALLYAEKKDVLIVKSAGNEELNLDKKLRYPNDVDNLRKEFVNNMIVVGGSDRFVDHRILYEYTNYGKNSVDIFAPGSNISTLKPNNNYTTSTGTSYAAPIVSFVASIIRSYYPILKANEVKKIIMESGTPYDIDVEITQDDGTKKMVPFSSLSKSGKIVNAYNALVMAEKISALKDK
ncbi:S8 family serine peptidase [Aquimarina sp. ERC-38]|uniref:S8 family serine peptidase n=1 Tax=Aquimarina sp. ERC-38 TaxID=2949996 RepID=UPI002246A480|nr:S8 family serine peptidase [Aquimarina sp. ERC-38]UZO82065.1 S8 family serine peptidase [Aquimarina sp. ERC-38]